MKPHLVLLLASALGAASCSSESDDSKEFDDSTGRALATYRIDLHQFDGPEPLLLTNESLAFRPDLDAPVKVITTEGESFRKIYNRLPCQGSPTPAENDELADWGFSDAEDIASKQPVRLESVSVEMPDDPHGSYPISTICYAYHTADGKWHGHFEDFATTHNDAAKLGRAELQIQADNVDIMGIVIYHGLVSEISFVARPQ